MTQGLLQAAGGIGLFLLGMVLMTEGLRSLAGDALERSLRRFTKSPFSGAVSGMVATALVQSSSATTVTAVGFAGAAILTFPQALGIVFGANIGTTLSGWMVALLGFRVHMGTVASLLVLFGALLRLFGRGRSKRAGLAIAGFGVVFVGFTNLQQGMAGFEGLVTPESFPPDTWGGRALLVAIGVAITLVTQSSSAGVAAAIAAVGTGAIDFPQAAAMVIGMDVGTTVTAAIATVGASLPARRTGWAHVVYNLLTGTGAFLLLPLYVLLLERALPGAIDADPEFALVGFHTAFNLLGVLAVLPVAGPFARLVERLVPDRPLPLAAGLDRRFLGEPSVALRAVGVTLAELARRSFAALAPALADGRAPESLDEVGDALAETQRYLARIQTPGPSGEVDPREVSSLHAIDQLRRLLDRFDQHERLPPIAQDPILRDAAEHLRALLEDGAEASAEALSALEGELSAGRSAYRRGVLRDASSDVLAGEAAVARLDSYRWLERVTHHAARILHHLARIRADERGAETESEPPEPD